MTKCPLLRTKPQVESLGYKYVAPRGQGGTAIFGTSSSSFEEVAEVTDCAEEENKSRITTRPQSHLKIESPGSRDQ